MDVLGICIGDNRHEAFDKLSISHKVKTGKNCFYTDETMFGNCIFSITYSYIEENINSIRMSYYQSSKGMNGHTSSPKEVSEKISEYFNLNLGLPISEKKTDRGRNATWSDMNITIRYFYQMRSLIEQDLEYSKELNAVIIEIVDFASQIKDDEFKKIFQLVRNHKIGKMTNTEQKKVGIKTKFNSQHTKYILLVILAFACMFIYAFSHRYQIVYNGKGIIDKWTGTVEEVKHKK